MIFLSVACYDIILKEMRALMKKVAVIMGSVSDFDTVKPACDLLKELGIPWEAHVYSAHRSPEEARNFAANAREKGYAVIIAAAGKAAHLAGALAAQTILPIIGIPVKSSALDGLDALLSTVQMPPGIPVATVAIDGAQNAAWLAAEIIALSDEGLANLLAEKRAAMHAKVLKADAELQAKLSS